MNKKKLMEHIRFTGGHFKDGKFYIEKDKVINLISQLDEPEVLSQEWIDEHSIGDWGEYVYAEDLQKILLPSQKTLELEKENEQLREVINKLQEKVRKADEPEVLRTDKLKPVIPQFVAEWIKDNYSEYERTNCKEVIIWDTFKTLFNFPGHMDDSMIDFLNNRADLFVRAVTDGYTVEEDKYYVLSTEKRMMLVRKMDGKTITQADPFPFEELHDSEKKAYRLTEKEIKNYDPRYLAFAIPAEEMTE